MGNLRDRLRHIQSIKKLEKPKEARRDISGLLEKGWEVCAFNVLKRYVKVKAPKMPKKLPPAAVIVIPDLGKCEMPSLGDFLFFDLETTGLSGGAGTIAFLAAFGRFEKAGTLGITQYLLLDYPGENDFLENVLKEFESPKSVIVSYNGKSFDSQIIKTRCLMNRMTPPAYHHADLLHPARRLWKSILSDCSQCSVETQVIGIDRSGDIPGFLAPEIWFEFLNTGRLERLEGICGHNSMDITGLAFILAKMINIASDPLGYNDYDKFKLAARWRDFCRKHSPDTDSLRVTGKSLLLKIADSNYPDSKKAQVLRVLAIDSERIEKNLNQALDYARLGLELKEAGEFWREDFERRVLRLERKMR